MGLNSNIFLVYINHLLTNKIFAASIFTKNILRVLHVSNAFKARQIVVNQSPLLGVALVINQWKQSGQGFELGLRGLEESL
jgi:acyl-CoA reductase-like NAD-dependent aldehyde dehydrogenase